jgi:hypothetical protein
MKVKVTEVQPGMLVDLADDPFAQTCSVEGCVLHRPDGPYNYEYAFVEGSEQETADCVRVDFDGDSIGFPVDHYLEVEGQR